MKVQRFADDREDLQGRKVGQVGGHEVQRSLVVGIRENMAIQGSTGIGTQDLGPNSTGPGGGQLQWPRDNSFILLNLTEPQRARFQSGKTVAPTSQSMKTALDCARETYSTALEGGCEGHHPSGSPTESAVSL